MDRLILFRHGKTEARASSGEDFDRELTARGRADARMTAQALKDAGLNPDRVLVSAAVRARQTWEAITDIFPAATVETRPELYDATAAALLGAGRLPLGRTVMIVAHNPGLQVLTIALAAKAGAAACEARARNGFATGAASAFQFSGETVQALGLYYPSDFGGGPD